MKQEINIKPIGGYFELELPVLPEYHSHAIALNSGRFCLEYILRSRRCKKIYILYYTCDSVLEPIVKLGLPYEFYHITEEYRISETISLSDAEVLLYTNYWGLQNDYCEELAKQYGKQLIFDCTQAFYSKPIRGIDTFYSCRKFFGVPDGGYLYSDVKADFEIEQDESYTRMDSLIKRIDLSSEAGYRDFHKVSASFHDMPLRRMSKFTKRMMQSIDYEQAAKQRISNYTALQQALGGRELCRGEVPMIFPYISKQGAILRNHLIQHKIFVAKYWQNVLEWTKEDAVETTMVNNILPLPIDQRYGKEDMERIIDLIKEYKNEY